MVYISLTLSHALNTVLCPLLWHATLQSGVIFSLLVLPKIIC